jgi:outer membrane protein OmpA-like peptidoglycan-associated protein
MKKYPSARLTLTGYTDVAAENTDKTLGLRRAEAVKEYLQRVWEIATSRITAKSGGARGLSEIIDAEENRIVEMQATTPEIFDELRYDYTLRTVQPPTLDVAPQITAPNGLAAWSVAIEQDMPSSAAPSNAAPSNAAIKRYGAFEGTIAPNIVTWGAQRVFANTAPLSSPLRITLQARDKAGESAQDRVNLPVEVLTVAEKQRRNSPDVRVGTYWVFCFNLNSKQVLVDERVRRAVQGITRYVTPGASVEIMDYSDTRGNVAKNRKLSDDRADAVLQLLRVPSSKIANVEGKGESTFYDNDLPEGRFYNRFVRVDVRTPVERKQ